MLIFPIVIQDRTGKVKRIEIVRRVLEGVEEQPGETVMERRKSLIRGDKLITKLRKPSP